MRSFQASLLIALLFLAPGCGLEELFGLPDATSDRPPRNPGGQATSEMDTTQPLSGEVYGLPFVPRSIVFATGINHAGLEETHIIAASARNYCEHIRDGIEEERSLRVMLRAVHYTGDQIAGHVSPGQYAQVEQVEALDDTLGVPAPSQVAVQGGSGRALTAGVAHVRPGCGGQRLFAAAQDSTLTIDAHDFTGIRGHISLLFEPDARVINANNWLNPNHFVYGGRTGALPEDGQGETLPIRVGGTFVATPCPWLGSVLNRDPQAPFWPHQCMGSMD